MAAYRSDQQPAVSTESHIRYVRRVRCTHGTAPTHAAPTQWHAIEFASWSDQSRTRRHQQPITQHNGRPPAAACAPACCLYQRSRSSLLVAEPIKALLYTRVAVSESSPL
jgi:hypothetical protein